MEFVASYFEILRKPCHQYYIFTFFKSFEITVFQCCGALAPLSMPQRHSAAAPLARTKKDGACHSGANVKHNGAVAVAPK